MVFSLFALALFTNAAVADNVENGVSGQQVAQQIIVAAQPE